MPNVERAAGSSVSMDDKSDEQLMELLCQGRQEALGVLVSRYENSVFRFCVHYLKDQERARDMAQETFLRVYSARARFDGNRAFGPWVLRIARNLCLNELRRRRTVTMTSLQDYATEAQHDGAEIFPSTADGPDAQAMDGERRAALEAALDQLDEEAREIIVLRFFQRMSAKEIAQIVGGTDGAIRTRLHRILKGLRKRVAPEKDDL